MTAEALQTVLDLQKQVEQYERLHLDLIYLLQNKSWKNIYIPKFDHYIGGTLLGMIKDLINENEQLKKSHEND